MNTSSAVLSLARLNASIANLNLSMLALVRVFRASTVGICLVAIDATERIVAGAGVGVVGIGAGFLPVATDFLVGDGALAFPFLPSFEESEPLSVSLLDSLLSLEYRCGGAGGAGLGTTGNFLVGVVLLTSPSSLPSLSSESDFEPASDLASA